MLKRLLKYVAPKSFLDGLERCNTAGLLSIAPRGIVRMLDVGCGDGTLTMRFAEAAGAVEVHGIEFVDTLRAAAEKKGIVCTALDLNASWDIPADSCDLIVSSQNIEHLHNTRLYLEECMRCLTPGGQLIVLTENLASWVNIGALVFGWQPFSTTNINGWSLGNPLIWHEGEPRDESFVGRWQSTGVSGTVGHVRVLAYRGMTDMLKKTGYTGIRVRTKGYLPLWGWISDLMCAIDRPHGHFIIATGFKPLDSA